MVLVRRGKWKCPPQSWHCTGRFNISCIPAFGLPSLQSGSLPKASPSSKNLYMFGLSSSRYFRRLKATCSVFLGRPWRALFRGGETTAPSNASWMAGTSGTGLGSGSGFATITADNSGSKLSTWNLVISLWHISHVMSPCPLNARRNSFQWPFFVLFPVCAGCQWALNSKPHLFNKFLAATCSSFCLFLSDRVPNTWSTASTKASSGGAAPTASAAASWIVWVSGSSAGTTWLLSGSCVWGSGFGRFGKASLESGRRGRLIIFTCPLCRMSDCILWTGSLARGSSFATSLSTLESPVYEDGWILSRPSSPWSHKVFKARSSTAHEGISILSRGCSHVCDHATLLITSNPKWNKCHRKKAVWWPRKNNKNLLWIYVNLIEFTWIYNNLHQELIRITQAFPHPQPPIFHCQAARNR